MGAYRDLIARRGVPRLATAAAFSRITTSMLGLSLLLAVARVHDSYASAGAVLTAHSVSLAVFAPIGGRLSDRYGSRRVLIGFIVAHAAAYAGVISALTMDLGVPIIGAGAVAVGATMPPAAPVTRAQWRILTSGDTQRSAYAFDSALNSMTFVVGPLLVSGLVLVVSPIIATVVAGVCKIVGDTLLATAPNLTDTAQEGAARIGVRRLLGPLAEPRVCLLLAVISLDTFTYGSLQIGAAAVADASGATGLLVAALAVGEVTGGLGYGARRWPGTGRRQLTLLHCAAAAIFVVMSTTTALIAIGLLYLAVGVAGGGRDTLNQIILGDIAPREYKTEAFGWLASFMWIGFGIGTSVAGQIESRFTTAGIHLVAAAASVAAAVALQHLRTDAPRGGRDIGVTGGTMTPPHRDRGHPDG